MIRLAVIVWLALTSVVAAHEIRPAYLQLDEVAPGVYDLVWKVPSNGDRVLDIQPVFDSRLTMTEIGKASEIAGFAVYRYRLTGQTALAGTAFSVPNLPNTTVDVLANIKLLDGAQHTFLLNPKSNAATVPETPSRWQVVETYTRLGVEHILLGLDHLLFVGSLMLVVRGWAMLLKTVTAFTIAHSITLALATFGLVSLPPAPVETMIALSIVLVSVEAVRLRRGETSLAIRWPWVVAFAFGLLHGFGFAGALLDIGMPQGDIPLALLFFNVGVELGQVMFIAAMLALVTLTSQLVAMPRAAPFAAAYAIGTLASFWVFERLDAAFF
ncbi:HupE/UreJ family protein [Mesorhizobium marinum]|uniref:HupE/UreJ family protein n=1 Tax=Mesorhizobium marinum TaxID=3228790 RepID=UPI0034672BF1